VSEERAGASPSRDLEAAEWEKHKWRAEYELKLREISLKEKEQQRSRWSNPLVVGIFAAAVAGIFSAAVALLNGWQEADLTKAKAKETQRAEETRSEGDRILEMIKTGDTANAARNLKFLIDTGLIAEPSRVKQIEAYLQKPGSIPVLPAANGRYTIEQSDATTAAYTPALQKSLDDYIVYLDSLGLPKPANKVRIHVTAHPKIENMASYYNPQDNSIEMLDSLANDIDTPRREYTHYILLAGKNIVGANLAGFEGGLTFYLPCSFADRPVHGQAAQPVLRAIDLSQSVPFKALKPDDYAELEALKKSWASLLWQVRTKLGQQTVDQIVVRAWLRSASWRDTQSDTSVAAKFTGQLLEEAKGISVDAADTFRSVMRDRQFPLSSPD
jgi:hypothetical protein